MDTLGSDRRREVDNAQGGPQGTACRNKDFAQSSRGSRRRWAWAVAGSMFVGAGAMLLVGQLGLGVAMAAAALLGVSWLLGYRGRVHRWPALLREQEQRRLSNG